METNLVITLTAQTSFVYNDPRTQAGLVMFPLTHPPSYDESQVSSDVFTEVCEYNVLGWGTF